MNSDPFLSKIWELQEILKKKNIPTWNALELNRAHKFKFSKWSEYSSIFRNFGDDLLKKGALRLPFDQAIFEYEAADDEINVLCHVFLCRHIKPEEIVEYDLHEEDKKQEILISIMGFHRKGDNTWQTASPAPQILSTVNGSSYCLCKELPIPESIDKILKCNTAIVKMTLGILASSCFIEKEIIVPNKIQQARSKQGKLPLFQFKIVELLLQNKIHHPPIGTHSSPALHWRRGHYRRLSNKIIPVSSCLVGDAANGIIDKNYDARNFNRDSL